MAVTDIIKPKGLYQRGKTWWGQKTISGRKLRFSLKTPDLATAIQVFNAISDAGFPAVSDWNFNNAWIIRRLDGARARSKKRGMSCCLSKQDIIDMVNRSSGKCELTGVWFHKPKNSTSKRNPWAPTIDRIDSSLPYNKENCRLVCNAVNTAIGEWGEQTFKVIIDGYLKNSIKSRHKACQSSLTAQYP